MENLTLAQAVQSTLQVAGISGRVTVEGTPVPGVVRLLGQVACEEDRLRADQVARGVDGVLDVMDEITLGKTAGLTRAAR